MAQLPFNFQVDSKTFKEIYEKYDQKTGALRRQKPLPFEFAPSVGGQQQQQQQNLNKTLNRDKQVTKKLPFYFAPEQSF
jgi:hypothetical protein